MMTLSKSTIGAVIAAFALTLTTACGGAGDTKTEKKVAEKKAPEKKVEKQPDPEPEEAPHEPDPKVAKAASIAKEIDAAPEKADEILEKHGLDRDAFEAMIVEIAKNPQMSSDYEGLLVES